MTQTLMFDVKTVLGAIHPEELGVTALSARVISPCPADVPESEWWRSVPRLFDKWQKDLNDYRELGGRSVVAGLGTGIKRHPEVYRLLARATGIHIILSTGFWNENDIARPSDPRDVDCYAEFFFNELTRGVAATRVKAAIIEINTPRPEMTDYDQAMVRAAARVVKRTGCPLALHGIRALSGQIRILTEEHVDASRVVIADCDDGSSLDLERDKDLCRQGFYAGYTHAGGEPSWQASPQAISDYTRADLIRAVIDAGYIDRVVTSAGPCPGSTTMPWAIPYDTVAPVALLHFVPKLYRVSLKDDDIDRLFIQNPRELLPSPGAPGESQPWPS